MTDHKFLEALREAKIAEMLYDLEIEFPELLKVDRQDRSPPDAPSGSEHSSCLAPSRISECPPSRQ